MRRRRASVRPGGGTMPARSRGGEVPAGLDGVVREALREAGCLPVRIRMNGGTLQVLAERMDGGMALDDCRRASRAISLFLGAAGFSPVPLEVSSPGIGRPLAGPEDYGRFRGQRVRLELGAPAAGGRRVFTGILAGCGGDSVTVICDDGEVVLGLSDIMKARLATESVLPGSSGGRRAGRVRAAGRDRGRDGTATG